MEAGISHARPAVGRAVDRITSLGTGATIATPVPLAGPAPRVTVVVPCYNYGHLLPGCIGSVLGQDGVAVDVIVVDDASPDGSGDVAERMATGDGRIAVVRHRSNAGHIATYNDGIGRAKGDYVVLLSADDMLTPGSLGRAVALMEANPSVGFVYGNVLPFSADHRPDARTVARSWAIWPGATWLSRRFRTSRNVIWCPEVVMRTSVQRAVGEYRPELPHAADLEMWMRAAAVADVGYILGADQAYYRLHASNMHATNHDGRQLSGVLADLAQRRLVFELLADAAPDPADAFAARRALALEALTVARRAYTFGLTDHAVADGFMAFLRAVRQPPPPSEPLDFGPVESLVSFAAEVCPAATRLPEWHAVQASSKSIGRGRPTNDPYFLVQDTLMRGKNKLQRWRWDRIGK